MFSSFENYVHKGLIYLKKRFLHAVKQGCMLNFLLQAVLYIGSNYLKAKKKQKQPFLENQFWNYFELFNVKLLNN